MEVLFILIVVVGAAGWAIVKSDELSGLGRGARRGFPRAPHGELVRVEPMGDLPAEVAFRLRLRRCLPLFTSLAVFVLCLASQVLSCFSASEHAGSLLREMLSTPIPAALIAAEAFVRRHEEDRPIPAYILSLVGALVAQALLYWMIGFAGWAGEAVGIAHARETAGSVSFVLSGPAFALGSALAAAAMGRMARFRRHFADGTKNEIEVSSSSAAYRAYIGLMEDSRSEAKKARR